MVQPPQQKVDAILKFPVPTNKEQAQSLLGFAGYYLSVTSHFRWQLTLRRLVSERYFQLQITWSIWYATWAASCVRVGATIVPWKRKLSFCKSLQSLLRLPPVTMLTYHSPLRCIEAMRNRNAKLMRWSLEIKRFCLDIQHIPLKLNLLSDFCWVALRRWWTLRVQNTSCERVFPLKRSVIRFHISTSHSPQLLQIAESSIL